MISKETFQDSGLLKDPLGDHKGHWGTFKTVQQLDFGFKEFQNELSSTELVVILLSIEVLPHLQIQPIQKIFSNQLIAPRPSIRMWWCCFQYCSVRHGFRNICFYASSFIKRTPSSEVSPKCPPRNRSGQPWFLTGVKFSGRYQKCLEESLCKF